MSLKASSKSKNEVIKTLSLARSHVGMQGVYQHDSVKTKTGMTFSVFVPPGHTGAKFPVVWYLSGLTCTHANVTEKGEFRKACAELGMIFVAPDTSPRGSGIPDEVDSWQIGFGAGFYVDAIEEPWSRNYQMYSYILDELPTLLEQKFPADLSRQAIMGHSMGGHGALIAALKNPKRFISCSAFAPIVSPMTADWSKAAFEKYLGNSPTEQEKYDACELVRAGHRFSEFLIDQGESDQFLQTGLKPWLFEDVCKKAGIPLTLRMQPGYDHSYFFISTYMDDHLRWHASRMGIVR